MTGYSKSRTRIFYGWFALTGVMLLIFTMSGAFVYSFGVSLPVISEDMGWSRGTVAMALSLGILAFGLPSPLFGILVSRFGPRFTLIWGNLAAALAIAGLFAVREAWQFYILYIIIGFGGGLGGYIACATVATNWFVKRRSLALAIFTACGSLGWFVFPPVTTALIGAIDWRMTWLVLGGIVAVLGVGLGGVVLVRNRPQDMGLEPDGMPPGFITNESWTAGAHRAGESRGGAPMKDILKGRTIWLISGFAAANAFAVGTMSAHQVAYLEDIGFLPMVAATTVS